MGNCIGKKSPAQNKHRRHSPSAKLHSNNQLTTIPPLDQLNAPSSHLSDRKESDILFNNDEESEKKLVQDSSSLATTANGQFFFTHTPPLSPDQLSVQCKKFKSSDTVIDFSENAITLITNEHETTMGFLFSKEKEINNNDQEVPEIISESFDTFPSPSLSDSSFSSFSSNTAPFSSQDQLILSSSSSSSIDINHNQFHSLSYSKPTESHHQFSTILPASSSRSNKDLFLNQFHQNTISYHCKTLKSVIDDVVQQQFIRIHRRTQTVLIQHQQLYCIHLKDLKTFETPSLIYDENQNLVYITKYAHFNGLESMTCATKDISRIFSSCDHCSLLLSASKLHQCLHPFFLGNLTYNLVQICFNEINNNNLFGYIAQLNSNKFRQTIINNSKLNYSYNLDVDYTDFYFVIYVQSWPKEIRSMYEKRQRLWPLDINNLFDNTCFIRFNGNEDVTYATDRCFGCEKILSLLPNSSWSYTYTSIEAQLVLHMTDGHVRFASIVWNYLNGKSEGEFSFVIFKHTLFYFFEYYSSDSFTTSDLYSHIHVFIDFLFNRFQTKFIPHYFNPNYNLYNEKISINLINIKMNYLDLKNCSIYLLPKSSLYLYHLIYLIQFQSNFLQCLHSSKTNLIQTIIDTHESVMKQLLLGVKTYKQHLDSTIAIKSHRPLTLDCLYRYQEENVQLILDYLPLLRAKEPSLLIHSLWSIFIQYFNSLCDDLFIS